MKPLRGIQTDTVYHFESKIKIVFIPLKRKNKSRCRVINFITLEEETLTKLLVKNYDFQTSN
jgi:hypothetical protein